MADTHPPDNGQLARAKIMLPAVIILIIVGLAAILSLEYIRPDKENLPLITIIIGLLAPTLVSILALLTAQDTKGVATKTALLAEKTHDLVNSKMALLLEQTRVAAEAVGILKGAEQQRLQDAARLVTAASATEATIARAEQAAAKLLEVAATAAHTKKEQE